MILFKWESEQKMIFKKIKQTVCKNILTEKDLNLQYYLAIDVSETEIRNILFQLEKMSVRSIISHKTCWCEKIVMFMSFTFIDTETRYHITEKEILAVLQCLEKIQWLVKKSKHSTMLYIDHMTIRIILTDFKKEAASRIC